MYVLWLRVSYPLWFPFYKEVADRAAGSLTRHQSPLRPRGAHRVLPRPEPGAKAQGASVSRCFTTAGTDAPANLQLSASPSQKSHLEV